MKSLVDYIKVFEDVSVDDWILPTIQSLDPLFSIVENNIEIKNHGEYKFLKLEKYKNIPEDIFENLYGSLQMGLVQAVDEYYLQVDEFKYSCLSGSEPFVLTKYTKNDHVIRHSDYFPIRPRSLTMHLTFNNTFTGGEFSFFGGEYTIQPRKNQVIIFPANFVFNYEILPVTSGERWAAENWSN